MNCPYDFHTRYELAYKDLTQPRFCKCITSNKQLKTPQRLFDTFGISCFGIRYKVVRIIEERNDGISVTARLCSGWDTAIYIYTVWHSHLYCVAQSILRPVYIVKELLLYALLLVALSSAWLLSCRSNGWALVPSMCDKQFGPGCGGWFACKLVWGARCTACYMYRNRAMATYIAS